MSKMFFAEVYKYYYYFRTKVITICAAKSF